VIVGHWDVWYLRWLLDNHLFIQKVRHKLNIELLILIYNGPSNLCQMHLLILFKDCWINHLRIDLRWVLLNNISGLILLILKNCWKWKLYQILYLFLMGALIWPILKRNSFNKVFYYLYLYFKILKIHI
jgi:hypothetical protein